MIRYCVAGLNLNGKNVMADFFGWTGSTKHGSVMKLIACTAC